MTHPTIHPASDGALTQGRLATTTLKGNHYMDPWTRKALITSTALEAAVATYTDRNGRLVRRILIEADSTKGFRRRLRAFLDRFNAWRAEGNEGYFFVTSRDGEEAKSIPPGHSASR